MLSAVAAREEAGRKVFVVKAGLEAALRALRANMTTATEGGEATAGLTCLGKACRVEQL